MVEEITIALIGLILTGIGIVIGIFFNIKATQQNTKSQYYQIMKDLDERFHQIGDLPEEDLTKYVTYVANFAGFMMDLIDARIVPKNMVYPHYKRIFSKALWILNNTVDDDETKKSWHSFLDFCKNNNIKEERISLRRLNKGRIRSDGLNSIIFSSDENKDADIYRCTICTKMFGTKEEFVKHKAETQCKPKS